MPQGVNGIQAGSFECREISERHPDSGGKEKGDADDFQIRDISSTIFCRAIIIQSKKMLS